MHLRLPVAIGIVAVAAVAAAVRAVQHGPSAPPVPIAMSTDAPLPAALPSRAPFGVRRARSTVTVYVAGDVARAGVYALPATAGAGDALHAAGGASAGADLVAVNLAEPLTDGEEIVVPVVGAGDARHADTNADVRKHPRRHARHAHRKGRGHRRHSADDPATVAVPDVSAADPPAHVVDLNAADENELETLPGIGASLAARIVTFREINGPFATPDDLLDVGGMTQGRLDAIEPYVSAQ